MPRGPGTEPLLLSGLITAALAAAGYAGSRLPIPAHPSGMAKNKGRRVRSTASHGSSSMLPQSGPDLAVRPPTMTNVPSTVPRSIPNQVVWDIVKVDSEITTTTGSPFEMNYSFSLNDHPQSTNWKNLFDQWTIPQFTVSFESEMAPGSTSLPVTLYTALDFDSIGSLSSISAVEDYSTCRALVLMPTSKIVRSIRPCCKTSISGASNVGTARSWIDSAQSGASFFGIRSIYSTQAALRVCVRATIVYAFRNQI